MTVAEARKILKPPLIFGDAQQIAAVRFIEKVEECKEAIQSCEDWKDHEAAFDDVEECGECGRELDEECENYEECGSLRQSVLSCDCATEFEVDVKNAAITEIIGNL